ncbi:MAG: class I SAM-dependent methyltransferase [Anaerolineaceae bacterium]|nr:class I SAM-dependent methyltransferase [Anaerolineaceae bacterium]MBN2677087.1 class I SAM-dependent methyltransferase [Anaerolineaceae bacterium]
MLNGKPAFTPVPEGMQAAPRFVRGPEQGSPWRCANWIFLERAVDALPQDTVILDFGAGHGDFNAILNRRTTIALDVFPYDEIDVICNLEQINPFKKNSFDAIVLMNVLEHVRQPDKLLQTLRVLLKPTGMLIITIPFLLKLHQLPYDFNRFSHHQLKEMGLKAGLDILCIEGYYDPILLYQESTNNVKRHVLPGLPSLKRKTGRLILMCVTAILSLFKYVIGDGHVRDPFCEKSPYPIGYHVIFQPMEKGSTRG